MSMNPELKPRVLSYRNKMARALWQFVRIVLYRPSPRPMHGWRCMLLRIFGAKLGKSVHAYPTARIWAPWNLEMGDHSCLGDRVDCYCVDKICIGAGTTVSQYSFLCTASYDYDVLPMPLVTGPISIGDQAWIAADVFVGPGVSIGEGAVVLARSSVFKDVQAWSIMAGNPARFLRIRELWSRSFNSEEP